MTFSQPQSRVSGESSSTVRVRGRPANPYLEQLKVLVDVDVGTHGEEEDWVLLLLHG
jgi:hypothetical protein